MPKANSMHADSPWKDILEAYFPRFIEFFFPDIFPKIDWEKGHEFLDKELQKIAPDARTGRRTVDKLIKVWLKDGTEIWTVVHVEIQGTPDPEFAKRMYMYNYRLFDKHDKKIVSLAVLTDSRKSWRPDRYGYALCGCRVELQFPVVKLLDYLSDWSYLESSDNPFAVVVMAHLKGIETRKYPGNRLKWKLSLAKMLYGRGYQREDILELFRFIDWIMTLPEVLENRFSDDMYKFEEGMKMQYVTSIERIGMKKGKKEGIEEGVLKKAREAVIDVLEARFDTVPTPLISKIKKIKDTSILKMLLKNAIFVGSVNEFNEIMSQTQV